MTTPVQSRQTGGCSRHVSRNMRLTTYYAGLAICSLMLTPTHAALLPLQSPTRQGLTSPAPLAVQDSRPSLSHAVRETRNASASIAQLNEHVMALEFDLSDSTVTIWIKVLVVVICGGLQSKAAALWSESRILRKLRQRDPHLQLQPFPTSYCNLAKGRHYTISRMITIFYRFSFMAFDTLSSLYIVGVEGIGFEDSEALTALRVLISFGSFTVWGAFPFNARETIALLFSSLLYSGSLLVFGSGWVEIPNKVRLAFGSVRYLLLGFSFFLLLYDGMRAWRSSDESISSIANILLARSKGGNQKLSDRQSKRLNEMRSTTGPPGRYWAMDKKQLFYALSILLFCLTNGVVWGEDTRYKLPINVIVEPLELISNVLFMVQDTQVEPLLFKELAQANASAMSWESVDSLSALKGSS